MRLSNLVLLLAAAVMWGCASTSFKEDAHALSPERATVFGRATVVKEGRPQELDSLGGSTLTLAVRRENDAEVTRYTIRDPGYFFWDLPPGKYMILGYTHMVTRGSVRMEFVVPPGAKALYVGDLVINMRGDYYEIEYNTDLAAGAEAFRKKFPGNQIAPERANAGMEKKPGNYSNVTWICGPNWGIDCKGGTTGVAPIYPEERDGVVNSLAPTLKWTPSPQPDVTYDVLVYEDQKIPRNPLGAVMDSLPGRQIYYAEALRDPMVRLDPPLRPGGSYLWSVRLRRGETVSTWSTYGYFHFFLVGWQSGRGRWFSFSTPAK